ncbi:MAG: hypothetical protein BRD35_06875 [Bacteroidetes bacterium QH_7_62_13]|nr:MAG: hypothetical protein BRD35_06875 [Bacteroidetes bacterium QH_7_62_13]
MDLVRTGFFHNEDELPHSGEKIIPAVRAAEPLEPPPVSFNVDTDGRMHEVLGEAQHFAVHLLSDGQAEPCTHVAIPDQAGADQPAEVTYRTDEHGPPILSAAPAGLHCRRHDALAAGDHTILVGRGVAFDQRADARPILYDEPDCRSATTEVNAQGQVTTGFSGNEEWTSACPPPTARSVSGSYEQGGTGRTPTNVNIGPVRIPITPAGVPAWR